MTFTTRTIFVLLLVSINFMCLADTITLSDGNQVELIYLGSGTRHRFDTRSLLDKVHRKLPDSIRKLVSRKPDGHISMITGDDSIGIGLRYKREKADQIPLSELLWLIADDTGWYFGGQGNGLRSADHVGRTFPLSPRAPKSLRFMLYSRQPDGTLSLAGDISVKNPRYDPSVSSSTSPPKPRVQKVGPIELRIEKLYTGIYVPDGAGSTCNELTTNVKALLASRPQRAVLPQPARSALVFRLTKDGRPMDNIRNFKIVITDSKGSDYNYINSEFYSTSTTHALIWDNNLPITDGDYQFKLTVMEDPPSTSTAWHLMPLKADGAISHLNMKRSKINARIVPGSRTINLVSETDPEMLSIQAVATGTSTPLKTCYQQPGRFKRPYEGILTYAELLNQNLETSATVSLRFAVPISHTLTFSGTPERPK